MRDVMWVRPDGERVLLVDRDEAARLVDLARHAGFGFSEPPRRPALVKVRPLLEDRSGRLDAVIGETLRA